MIKLICASEAVFQKGFDYVYNEENGLKPNKVNNKTKNKAKPYKTGQNYLKQQWQALNNRIHACGPWGRKTGEEHSIYL